MPVFLVSTCTSDCDEYLVFLYKDIRYIFFFCLFDNSNKTVLLVSKFFKRMHAHSQFTNNPVIKNSRW